MGRRRQHANATERKRANRAQHRMRLQVPCVEITPTCRLYLGDALVIAPTLQDIDAVVTDPPYGTNFDFTTQRRSRTPLTRRSAAAPWTTNVLGDDQPFDPTPWLTYPQVILWGANHYWGRLPAAHGWITWDKRCGSTPDNHPSCELAWSNIPGSSFTHEQLWRGMIRAGEENLANGPKLHPAQKPVDLLQRCVLKTTGVVLDPYMGSGTTGLACLRLGRPFVGIERDPDSFRVACERLQAAARQLPLFPTPSTPVARP